jgi:hypothetical protein
LGAQNELKLIFEHVQLSKNFLGIILHRIWGGQNARSAPADGGWTSFAEGSYPLSQRAAIAKARYRKGPLSQKPAIAKARYRKKSVITKGRYRKGPLSQRPAIAKDAMSRNVTCHAMSSHVLSRHVTSHNVMP